MLIKINKDKTPSSIDWITDLQKSWRKSMHLAYMFTHPKHQHTTECLFCKQNNCQQSDNAEIKFLETATKNESKDIRSVSLFCLGTYFTTINNNSLQRGLNYLKQSAELGNKEACRYLAAIHAGVHKLSSLQSFADEKSAIDLYKQSFFYGSYEALEDLMFFLRNGEAKNISKNISYWQELFNKLFLHETKLNNTENINALIKCLIRQTKEITENDNALFRIVDILKSWIKSTHWNETYSATARKYLHQEICENNKNALYVNNELGIIPKDGMTIRPGVFWIGNTLFKENTTQKSNANSNIDVQQEDITDDKSEEKNYFNYLILKNSLLNEKESLEKIQFMLEKKEIDMMTYFSLAVSKINKFTDNLDEYIKLNGQKTYAHSISLTETTQTVYEKIKQHSGLKQSSTTDEIKELLLSLNEKILEYLNVITQIDDSHYVSLNIKQIVLSCMQNIIIMIDSLTKYYNEKSYESNIIQNNL